MKPCILLLATLACRPKDQLDRPTVTSHAPLAPSQPQVLTLDEFEARKAAEKA